MKQVIDVHVLKSWRYIGRSAGWQNAVMATSGAKDIDGSLRATDEIAMLT